MSVSSKNTPVGGCKRAGSSNNLVQPGGFGGGGSSFTINDIIDGQHGIGTSGTDYIIYTPATASGSNHNSLNDNLNNSGTTQYTFDIPADWTMCRIQLYSTTFQGQTADVVYELFGSSKLCASVLATTDYHTGRCLSSPPQVYFSLTDGPYNYYDLISKTYDQLNLQTGTAFVGPTYGIVAGQNIQYALPGFGVTAYIQGCYIPTSGTLNLIFNTTTTSSSLSTSFGRNYMVVISRIPT